MIDQASGGAQTEPTGPNENGGITVASPGGAAGYSSSAPRGGRSWPSLSTEFAARIAGQSRWLTTRLTRYLLFTVANQQPGRLPTGKVDNISLPVDDWVDRILSPIQEIITYVLSKFERSAHPGGPLNFTWASPPERMVGSQDYTGVKYTDDIDAAGHPEVAAGDYVSAESGEEVVPQPRPDIGEADRPFTDSGAVVPGRENQPVHKATFHSLPKPDNLTRRIGRHLHIPVGAEAAHDRIISSQEDITSTTHHPLAHEVPSTATDSTHYDVNGPEETSAGAKPKGISGYDLTETHQQTRQTRQPSSLPDLSRLLSDKARRVIDLSTLWSSLARTGESIELFAERTALAERETGQGERQLTGMHLRGPMLKNSLTFASDRLHSATMVDSELAVAEKPGAGPGRVESAVAGHRPNEAAERKVSEETSAVQNVPSRAPYSETGIPLSLDVVHKYRLPMRLASLMTEGESAAFAVAGTESPRPQTETPADVRGFGLSRARHFVPGPSISGSPPFSFRQTEITEARWADDQTMQESPFQRHLGIPPEGYPSLAGSSLTHPSPLHSIRSEPEGPGGQSPVQGNEYDVLGEVESALWGDYALAAKVFEPTLHFPTAQAGHAKSMASRGDLPLAVFAGSPGRGEGAAASIAKAPLDRPTGGRNSGTVSAAEGAANAATTSQSGAASVDIDSLARDVYQIIRRRLAVEKERRVFGG